MARAAALGSGTSSSTTGARRRKNKPNEDIAFAVVDVKPSKNKSSSTCTGTKDREEQNSLLVRGSKSTSPPPRRRAAEAQPASGEVRTPKASAHFGCDFLEIAEDVLQKREPDKFKEYKNATTRTTDHSFTPAAVSALGGGGCTTTVDVDADDNMFPDEVQRGSSTIGGSTTARIFGHTPDFAAMLAPGEQGASSPKNAGGCTTTVDVEDADDNMFLDEVQRGSSTIGGNTTAQIFGRTADCFDIMRAPGEQGASSSTAAASWSAATPTPNHYASTPALVQEETQQPEPLQHSRKGFSACRTTTSGGLAYGKKLFAQALLHEHKNAVAAELRPPKKRAVLLDKKHKPIVAAAVSEVLSSTVARRSRSACSTASVEGANKAIGGYYVESVYQLLQKFLPKRMSYTPHEKALKAWTGAALYIVAFGEQLPLTLKAICTVLKIRSPAGNKKERAHDAATGTSKADPAGIGGSGGGRSKEMQKKVAAICAEFPGEVEKPCPFAVQDFCEIDKVMQRLPMLVGSSAWREMREMEAAEERLAEVGCGSKPRAEAATSSSAATRRCGNVKLASPTPITPRGGGRGKRPSGGKSRLSSTATSARANRRSQGRRTNKSTATKTRKAPANSTAAWEQVRREEADEFDRLFDFDFLPDAELPPEQDQEAGRDEISAPGSRSLAVAVPASSSNEVDCRATKSGSKELPARKAALLPPAGIKSSKTTNAAARVPAQEKSLQLVQHRNHEVEQLQVETARSSSRKQDDLAVKALAWAAAEYEAVPENVWKQISRGAISLATVARLGAVCNNAGSNRSTTALAAACVYLSIQMARNGTETSNYMNANVLATFSSAAGGGGHLRLKEMEEFVTLEQMAYFTDQSHSGIYAKVANVKKIFLGACEGLPWHAWMKPRGKKDRRSCFFELVPFVAKHFAKLREIQRHRDNADEAATTSCASSSSSSRPASGTMAGRELLDDGASSSLSSSASRAGLRTSSAAGASAPTSSTKRGFWDDFRTLHLYLTRKQEEFANGQQKLSFQQVMENARRGVARGTTAARDQNCKRKSIDADPATTVRWPTDDIEAPDPHTDGGTHTDRKNKKKRRNSSSAIAFRPHDAELDSKIRNRCSRDEKAFAENMEILRNNIVDRAERERLCSSTRPKPTATTSCSAISPSVTTRGTGSGRASASSSSSSSCTSSSTPTTCGSSSSTTLASGVRTRGPRRKTFLHTKERVLADTRLRQTLVRHLEKTCAAIPRLTDIDAPADVFEDDEMQVPDKHKSSASMSSSCSSAEEQSSQRKRRKIDKTGCETNFSANHVPVALAGSEEEDMDFTTTAGGDALLRALQKGLSRDVFDDGTDTRHGGEKSQTSLFLSGEEDTHAGNGLSIVPLHVGGGRTVGTAEPERRDEAAQHGIVPSCGGAGSLSSTRSSGASSNTNSKPQPEVLSSASASSGARGGVFGSRDSVLYPCKPVMFPELQAVQRLYQTAQTAERSSLRSNAAAARRVVQAARDAELLTPALEATMVHDIIGAKLRLRPTTFLQDAEKIQGLLDAQKAAVQARAAAEQARRLAACDKQRGALALPGLAKKQVFGSLANKKPVCGRSGNVLLAAGPAPAGGGTSEITAKRVSRVLAAKPKAIEDAHSATEVGAFRAARPPTSVAPPRVGLSGRGGPGGATSSRAPKPKLAAPAKGSDKNKNKQPAAALGKTPAPTGAGLKKARKK